jgi:hypothetical protein
MSLAGDDGKGKSALCGGRLMLMAVEQIVLPSLLIPSWGDRRRPRREARTPAGLPNARWRRPEKLAFSVDRIEKPQRKPDVRERFRASGASSRCTAARQKRLNSWASAGRPARIERVRSGGIGGQGGFELSVPDGTRIPEMREVSGNETASLSH